MGVVSRSDLVFKLVGLIPKGKVTTYKSVAQVCGLNNPRSVGSFLHLNKDSREVPCHRVVRIDGSLAAGYAFGGRSVQKSKLVSEGVVFVGGRVGELRHFWRPTELTRIFLNLWEEFGEPGLWPWFDYGKASDRDEIAIGAILTANTNWRNVEYALGNLRRARVSSLRAIYVLGKKNLGKLKGLIQPSGFYNQKADRLFRFSRFVGEEFGSLKEFGGVPWQRARGMLLGLSGIGQETADTILLYALNKPVFVVDVYTRRLVRYYKLNQSLDYESLREFFEQNLPRNVRLYQDFHALIVRWGKTKTQSSPVGTEPTA